MARAAGVLNEFYFRNATIAVLGKSPVSFYSAQLKGHIAYTLKSFLAIWLCNPFHMVGLPFPRRLVSEPLENSYPSTVAICRDRDAIADDTGYVAIAGYFNKGAREHLEMRSKNVSRFVTPP